MTTKRVRVSSTANATFQLAPPALITQLFDCLSQAPHKQLVHLLSVLVKACPASTLQKVRDEAAKIGMLITTSSRYQQCGHSMLDSFFSFLCVVDLKNVELVCVRWRMACFESGAGWTTALSLPQSKKEKL